jgi:hypothetical protein
MMHLRKYIKLSGLLAVIPAMATCSTRSLSANQQKGAHYSSFAMKDPELASWRTNQQLVADQQNASIVLATEDWQTFVCVRSDSSNNKSVEEPIPIGELHSYFSPPYRQNLGSVIIIVPPVVHVGSKSGDQLVQEIESVLRRAGTQHISFQTQWHGLFVELRRE